MITYYYLEGIDYRYHSVYINIAKFYILKEGLINTYAYRDDPNDSYYILDSYGTPGTRNDYIIPRDSIRDNDLFNDIKEFENYVKERIDEFYKQECLNIFKETQKAMKWFEKKEWTK